MLSNQTGFRISITDFLNKGLGNRECQVIIGSMWNVDFVEMCFTHF